MQENGVILGKGEKIWTAREIDTLVESAIRRAGEAAEKDKSAVILWPAVYKSAQALLAAYQAALGGKELITFTRIKKSKLEGKGKDFLDEYRKKQKEYFAQLKALKPVYEWAFIFDKALTAYREESPKQVAYTIIDPETHIPTTYIITLDQLQKKATQYGRINIGAKNQLLKNKKTLEQQIANEDSMKRHLLLAQYAYTGTYERLQRYLDVRRQAKEAIDLQSQNMTLLFKKEDQWRVTKVLNFGDVGEAYVAALLANHADRCLCSDVGEEYNAEEPYQSHVLISNFFDKYIQKVDNNPAIVNEDVKGLIPGQKQAFQFAVKTQGAALPSLNQYIDAAKEVLKYTLIKNPMSQAAVEEYLETKKLSTIRNYYVDELDEKTKKELKKLEDIFDDYEKI